MVKFIGQGYTVLPDADAKLFGSAVRHSEDYAENDESLILTHDKRTGIYEHHSAYDFNPVVFKGGLNGFRITKIVDLRSFRDPRGVFSTNWHFALGDTPVEVGEDDVEMIMGAGKAWKKFEKPKPAAAPAPAEADPPESAPPPVAEPLPTVTNEPPPVTADEGSATPPRDTQHTAARDVTLPLFLAILLVFCAVLYYVWRKTK
jgi:hypothetical protein